MTIVWAIVGFILAIVILVTIHELGHYYAARFFKIKVTRFSIGFGRTIFSFNKGETTFQVAMIPLGGYVQFLDEQDQNLNKDEDLTRAYNRQPVLVRFAVVAAGPIVNLIFAWIVFSLIYFYGITGLKPVFEKVTEYSPLSSLFYNLNEPQQVLEINQNKVNTWQEVEQQLLFALVADKPFVTLKTSSFYDELNVNNFKLALTQLDINNINESRINQVGFVPKLPQVAAILNNIQANSPAENAGFIAKDKILTVDGVLIDNWQQFVNLVRKSPNKNLLITYLRNNIVYEIDVPIYSKQYSRQQQGKVIGFFGASVFFDAVEYSPYRAKTDYSFLAAIKLGYEHSINLINMSLMMIKRMLFGEIDPAHLSGPISIADYSGQALQMGWGSFFYLLALLSLSLGILNLLPIPVLDGGHLLLYIIEMIKGIPLSTQLELVLQKIGIVLILSLTFFALFNDMVRISND